jgi:hypothetical protein
MWPSISTSTYSNRRPRRYRQWIPPMKRAPNGAAPQQIRPVRCESTRRSACPRAAGRAAARAARPCGVRFGAFWGRVPAREIRIPGCMLMSGSGLGFQGPSSRTIRPMRNGDRKARGAQNGGTGDPPVHRPPTQPLVFQSKAEPGGVGLGRARVTTWSRQGHGRVTAGSRKGHGRVTAGSRKGHGRVTAGSRKGHDRVTEGSR